MIWKLCPGYPLGSCLTWIEWRVFLCGFCKRSMELAA